MVPCIHHNGDLTGYSVQYREVWGKGTQTMNVSGGNASQTTISGLEPSKTYSIQVAAVNSAGVGLYSSPTYQLTLGNECWLYHSPLFGDHFFLFSVEAPSITVNMTSVTSTTIPLTWTSAGSEVNSYEVEWRYDGECFDVMGGRANVTGHEDMTSYTIKDLEEYITYSITVTATNNVSSAVSEVATVRTSKVGEVISRVTDSCPPCAVFDSLQLLPVLPLQLVPLAHPPP